MKEVAISATARSTRGKGQARQSRRSGRIPAVVYGPEISPMPLEIDEKDLRAALRSAHAGGASIFNLDIDGSQKKVILRELQLDPVTSKVLHVDFHAISMNKPIHIAVPIHFTGIARGVKSDGGIMQTTMREVEIACLPTEIPEHVEVDVSDLGIGDAIHVESLSMPGVKILSEGRQTMVVISAPTVVKAVEAAVEPTEAAVAGEEGEVAEGEGEKEEGKEEPKEEGKEKSKEKSKERDRSKEK